MPEVGDVIQGTAEEHPSFLSTGIAVAIGAVAGMLLSTIGTGIHAGELIALQRQSAAIESIADTMRHECVPADGTMDVSGSLETY